MMAMQGNREPSIRKARARTAHGKPKETNNLRSRIGYKIPAVARQICFRQRQSCLPVLLPVAAIPVASMRFLRKYRGMTATDVKPRSPLPIPTQKACARRICQYLVHKLSMNIPKVVMVVPTISINLRYPPSISHPAKTPISIIRHICIDPIHAITEGLVSGSKTFL